MPIDEAHLDEAHQPLTRIDALGATARNLNALRNSCPVPASTYVPGSKTDAQYDLTSQPATPLSVARDIFTARLSVSEDTLRIRARNVVLPYSKGKPAARWGRKASGLKSCLVAGLR